MVLRKLSYLIAAYLIFVINLAADPVKIDVIEDVVKEVKALRAKGISPENIGVILDFHGVVTNQREHDDFLTLKGNIRKALAYLHEENIPFVIATAWSDLSSVVQAIDKLKLINFFPMIKLEAKPKFELVSLGKDKNVTLQAYQNGNIVSLKRVGSPETWCRQKAFSLERVYPDGQFEHVFFVDDSEHNTRVFEEDLRDTGHSPENVMLYLLSEKHSYSLDCLQPSESSSEPEDD